MLQVFRCSHVRIFESECESVTTITNGELGAVCQKYCRNAEKKKTKKKRNNFFEKDSEENEVFNLFMVYL